VFLNFFQSNLDTKTFINLTTKKNNQGQYFDKDSFEFPMKDFVAKTPITNSTESFKLMCMIIEKYKWFIAGTIKTRLEDPQFKPTLQYLLTLRDENNQTLSDAAEKNEDVWVSIIWKRFLMGIFKEDSYSKTWTHPFKKLPFFK
jgi:hypothetical protein